jgi:hypothetical protein
MEHLPKAITALRVIKGFVSILPHGDKVGVGVELAITLCETIQVRRKCPPPYPR